MHLAAGPGSNESALRAGSIRAAAIVENPAQSSVGHSVLARLTGSAAGPGALGAIDIVGVLLLVGLLLIGLIVISAGCGPPN